MNARIQVAQTNQEKQHIGKHTFQPETANLEGQTEELQYSRNKLVNLCVQNDLILANTKFQKQKEKIATYRKIGSTIGDEIKRPTHEQLDYIITTNRWKTQYKTQNQTQMQT